MATFPGKMKFSQVLPIRVNRLYARWESLCASLKDKSGDVLDFFLCRQIMWKDHQQWIVQVHELEAWYSCKNYENTSISHTAALCDILLHYDKHGHCSFFRVNPTYTVLLQWILAGATNLLWNIIPNKYTGWVMFAWNDSVQLFQEIMIDVIKLKVHVLICFS